MTAYSRSRFLRRLYCSAEPAVLHTVQRLASLSTSCRAGISPVFARLPGAIAISTCLQRALMLLRVNCTRCLILYFAASCSMAIPATGSSLSMHRIPGYASADSSIGLHSQKQETVSDRCLLTYTSSFPFLARCSKPLLPLVSFYSSPLFTGKTAETQCNAVLSQHCRRTFMLPTPLLWVSQLSLIFLGPRRPSPKKRPPACRLSRHATLCRVSSCCLATGCVSMFVLRISSRLVIVGSTDHVW